MPWRGNAKMSGLLRRRPAMPAHDPSTESADPSAATTAVPGRAFKKLSVLLPADLHQRARRHALLHDKTLTTLIIELLNQALEASEREPPPV